jgi:hypothetical protein
MEYPPMHCLPAHSTLHIITTFAEDCSNMYATALPTVGRLKMGRLPSFADPCELFLNHYLPSSSYSPVLKIVQILMCRLKTKMKINEIFEISSILDESRSENTAIMLPTRGIMDLEMIFSR